MADETQTAVQEVSAKNIPAAASTGIGPFHWLITTLITVVVSGTALAIGWAYYQQHRTPAFATVDIQSVMLSHEKSFAALVSKGDGSKAYDLATRTGPAITAALTQLSSQCGCVLLVSQAVAGPNVANLTDRLNQLIDANLAAAPAPTTPSTTPPQGTAR